MENKIPSRKLKDYFLDEISQKVKRKEYASVIDNYTTSATLHKLRAKTACLNKIVAQERSRHFQKKEEFGKRWNLAYENFKKLDSSITSLDSTYKNNLIETNKLLKEISQENQLNSKKLERIGHLQQEKKFLQLHLKNTNERLDNYRPVTSYLHKVVDSSFGEFNDVQELINRSQELLNVRQDLIKRKNYLEKLKEKKEIQYGHISLVKENEGVILNNLMFEESEQLMEAKDQYEKILNEITTIKSTTSRRTTLLAQLRSSIYNIYLKISEQLKIQPIIPMWDVFGQIVAIKGLMKELKRMHQLIEGMIQRAEAEHEHESRLHILNEKRHVGIKHKKGKVKVKKPQEKYKELFHLDQIINSEISNQTSTIERSYTSAKHTYLN